MALEIRTIRDDEVDAFCRCIFEVFGTEVDADPGLDDRVRALLDPAQRWAAFDGGQLVATAGTFELELGVPPDRTIAMAGLTMVTVRPTHRRRGLLRGLMAAHLDDARARGRAISGLWASEASIYGRFGYGLASFQDAVEISDAHRLVVAAGRALDDLAYLEASEAAAALPELYARATANRPGALRRGELWWRERRFSETPWARRGASRLRHVAARRGDHLVGYLAYRQRGGFTDGAPSGTVEITELIAADPRAEATLWRFALSVDLCPRVTWWNAPVDDSLWWIVDDARRVRRRRTDNLWLRIDDPPAALRARSYGADGTVRFGLDQATWALTVEGGEARCEPAAGDPEVRLDRDTLGALYLGATSATTLARADRIQGTAGAIATLDRCFASPIAPWCPEVF